MVGNLINAEDCAKCKLCCTFDSYDLWETPIITNEMASRILQELKPQQKFIKRDEHFLLKMDKEPDADLYYCSLLDHEKGCALGKDKPFDCKIWPFRVMALNEVMVITLSPVCPVVNKKPMDEIIETAKKLAPVIFEEAEKNPMIVKPYLKGYPIVVVDDSKFSETLIK